MTTNVPLPSFGPDGFASPEELAILAGVLADFNAAFGGNLNIDVSTPQGQLATSLAALVGAFNDLFVDYTNQVDPAFSTGRMQDAIGRIYGITRRGPIATSVIARCSGATGVTIPVGSLARATDGTIYSALATGTIDSNGWVDLPFAALTPGPIECPAGTLTTIYRTIPGWDSITNPAAGTPGRNAETRQEFEERRISSVAANAVGILPSVRASVLSVDGVIDAYVTENPTATTATIGGVSLAAHSLYVCVVGGEDADVAKAIWLKKPPGCNYNGSTTVVVEDDNSGYLTPPTYSVKFQRAAPKVVDIDIEIADGPNVPNDAASQIESVIQGAWVDMARIGQTLYASSFVCPVGALGSWARVITIELNGAASESFDIDEVPSLGTVSVAVV